MYPISEETIATGSPNICIQATFDHLEPKTNTVYLYLTDCSFYLGHQKYTFSDFLAVFSIEDLPQTSHLFAGNTIQIEGELSSFQLPTNPGQFDERAYYKEKNIFYKIYGKKLSCSSKARSYPKVILYQYKEKLCRVVEKSISIKHSGIIKAMLFGEKSTLDIKVKKLYQISGIGHLLAISGLHITILCTMLSVLLSKTNLPRLLQFFLTVGFLICYGIMTGFSISTSRAVIMMCMLLSAPLLKRSYDGITAMALSALIILLQKPYAIFSCSFLLSYSAVLGIYWIQPVLKHLILGNEEQQEKRRRKRKRVLAEAKASPYQYYTFKIIYLFCDKMVSTLIGSFSISITTLPFMLYFFYEIPTYSILLNLIVLPLSSGLLLCSALGGILGSIWLPLGTVPFTMVTFILNLYEGASRFFFSLPHPVQVLGRPKLWQIILYFICIVIIGYLFKSIETKQTASLSLQRKWLIVSKLFCGGLFVCGLFCLLYRPLPAPLECHMLDVGQGDGILLQNAKGQNVLIDGGSTSVSKVGTYRIIPFLKYYGIDKLDALVVTHADEDHISGQLELLMTMKENGITIHKLLLPEPSEERRADENYQLLLRTAGKVKVQTGYIHKGEHFFFGDVRVQCLHPPKGFETDSANAYSTTLLLTLGNHRLLFTGDLEEEGEEAVLSWLTSNNIKDINVLKVAHHGSKNSTSEEFLAQIRPRIALISCGKKNRYGHPHAELLKRLKAHKTKVFRTDQCGAIRIFMNKQSISIENYHDI